MRAREPHPAMRSLGQCFCNLIEPGKRSLVSRRVTQGSAAKPAQPAIQRQLRQRLCNLAAKPIKIVLARLHNTHQFARNALRRF